MSTNHTYPYPDLEQIDLIFQFEQKNRQQRQQDELLDLLSFFAVVCLLIIVLLSIIIYIKRMIVKNKVVKSKKERNLVIYNHKDHDSSTLQVNLPASRRTENVMLNEAVPYKIRGALGKKIWMAH